ncbi:MAG: hypothetical protein IT562_07070 [Alphaproteobacteria bacterium]|nr:hypothetical protein [Alphaproteobacteria bacterium]
MGIIRYIHTNITFAKRGAMTMLSNLRAAAIAAALGLLAATLSPAGAGPVTISGEVGGASAGSFSISQLQALGSTTQTVGGDTYVGVSLWTLLGGAPAGGTSNIIPTGSGNNTILRSYITAIGTDGRTSLVSVGEINPFFGSGPGPAAPGNQPLYAGSLPAIVAYQQNGQLLDTPKLIVPQDATGTRSVGNLGSLVVGSAVQPPAGPGGPSTQFTLTGGTNGPATYDLPALQSRPSVHIDDVQFFSGQNLSQQMDFVGVSLWGLLTDAGIDGFDVLTSYLLVTGTDGYQVILALAEIDPALTGRDYIVAYEVNGAGLGSGGFARLVLPGDLRGGRYVSNVASLEIVHVPAPAALGLLAFGLLALSAAGRRKPRA